MTEVTDADVRGVVVHLAEASAERHRAVLQNLRNLHAALGVGVPIELIAHGPGVDLLIGASGEARSLNAVMDLGVRVHACNNTLNARGLVGGDLVSGVGVVDSGVAHLARRQFDGWAYLRP